MKKGFFLIMLSLLFFACNNEEEFTKTTEGIQDEMPMRLFGVKTLDDFGEYGISTRAVIEKDKKWARPDTLPLKERIPITIKFLNGSTAQKEFVENTAVAWEEHANVKFVYVNGNADVRIGFELNGDKVTGSLIGNEAKVIDFQFIPTANIASVTDEIIRNGGYLKKNAKGQVLQVFGHILGLVYEHQHHESNILLDAAAVYNKFSSQGWNYNQVMNLLKAVPQNQTNYSEFDPQSIMVYYVDPELTINNHEPLLNTVLSDTDKAFIEQEYPFDKDVSKSYYNGYQHDLPEPDWEKLKGINDLIGGTRDIDGNYYFYRYRMGDIVRYDKDLNNRTVLGTSTNVLYRNSPCIVPRDGQDTLLVRQAYVGSRFEAINMFAKNPTNEYAIPTMERHGYGALTYDYTREMLYFSKYVFDKQLNCIHHINPEDTNFQSGILYWGEKYKWTFRLKNTYGPGILNSDPTISIYEQSDAKDILSKSNLVAQVEIKDFYLNNGGYSTVYEYNDKLVLLNFRSGSSSPYGGKLLVVDTKGNYKIYNDREMKLTHYLCGGIFWKNKIMLYDENHNHSYFEIPELN